MTLSASAPAARLEEARFPEDADRLRRLFRAYQASIGVDLGFQGFEQELAELPGVYARPAGNAWLVRHAGEAAGCVAVRPLEAPEVCEMKRLYLEPALRGRGLGGRLAVGAVAWAAAAGYQVMRLDTLQSMATARAIYGRLGFAEVPAYYRNPLDGIVYLELDLAGWRRLQQEKP